ncbi:MAG: threonine--tRNA ligase [Clostridia bacterium]|nr:threonine--tRNA ligase [Clostridia bacterium]MDD4501631.1 threonine--tRNA ligase [Clostridia bacterium]NLV33287.1 threonine--tRNA ligase [Clostridiaceae bacterium]
MIKIKLPDGSIKEYEKAVTALEVASDISKGLAKSVVAAKIDGNVRSLTDPIKQDSDLLLLKFEDEGADHVYRHTSSHIMAHAVTSLFPGTKLAIGPSINNGFYYDFDTDHIFTDEDFPLIEKKMEEIIKADYPIERFTLPKNEALDFVKNNPYKYELVTDLDENEDISFYRQNDFVDLCAGPHLPSTGKVKVVKILSVAGAYWRGDEKNKMLQRLYATSFPSQAMLDEYIYKMEEAKKRDHRKLGKELDLYDIFEEGPGFPFFFPKGMEIRNQLIDYWRREHKRAGYGEIQTPIILNEELWHRSGHWDHYKNNMYFTTIDEGNYAIKPMNCPGGMLAFKRRMYSYRDLPLRTAELGLVHRHELSGALHGLMRVRCFTQDDAHIFMTEDQMKQEIVGVINLMEKIYSLFNFEYKVELSTKPENSMGTKEQWDIAENALQEALESLNMKYELNPGDGAFYGPKIDFHIQDSIGRTWQCGTIQLDFQMPERFDLTYMGADGNKHRPVMLHRALFGSIERFIAILTEHYAGAFPVWLSPVQVKILPLTDRQAEYAQKIRDILMANDIRVECDFRSEKIGYKIREAQLEKIPYMIVVGDKEMENNQVAVRVRKVGDIGTMFLEEFQNRIVKEINEKV